MKSVLQVIVEPHTFSAGDFIGGDPALDFVNTVAGRDQSPRDWLDSYERLLEWAALVRLFPRHILQRVAREAKKDSVAAGRALARAKAMREELFALLAAITGKGTVSKDAMVQLQKRWLAGTNTIELGFEDGRVVKQFSGEVDLDSIAKVIGYRMVEHVLTLPLERLRMCQGANCSWLFIDRSKGGRRRWCDMAVCGNAAKSRRFYARKDR